MGPYYTAPGAFVLITCLRDPNTLAQRDLLHSKECRVMVCVCGVCVCVCVHAHIAMVMCIQAIFLLKPVPVLKTPMPPDFTWHSINRTKNTSVIATGSLQRLLGIPWGVDMLL